MTDKARLGRLPPLPASHRLSQASLSHIRLHLSTSAFAAPTAAAYRAAASRYLAYCRHGGHHASSVELDRCVGEYICALYDHHGGRNRQLAVCQHRLRRVHAVPGGDRPAAWERAAAAWLEASHSIRVTSTAHVADSDSTGSNDGGKRLCELRHCHSCRVRWNAARWRAGRDL